jgi:hypothetical protein
VNPPWLTTAVTAALSAVLSSGVTAAYLRANEPDVVAVSPPPVVTPEQRSLASILVAPAAPYRAVDGGAPVDAKALGADGLESLGFRRGWSRTWRTGGKDRVDSFVLEFAGESGARSYAQGIGRVARLLVKPEPFTVTGVPGSSGLADTVKDRDGNYAQVVVMHSGPRAVLLVFANDSALPGADVLTLAQRQWAALSAT